jgi:hypothetical protein
LISLCAALFAALIFKIVQNTRIKKDLAAAESKISEFAKRKNDNGKEEEEEAADTVFTVLTVGLPGEKSTCFKSLEPKKSAFA